MPTKKKKTVKPKDVIAQNGAAEEKKRLEEQQKAFQRRYVEVMEPILKHLKKVGIKGGIIALFDPQIRELIPAYVGSTYDAARMAKHMLIQLRRKVDESLEDDPRGQEDGPIQG